MKENEINIKFKKGFSVKTIIKMATLGFLINSINSTADGIKATEGFGTKIQQNGNVFDITTSKIKGNNAFNSFESFDLEANKIANLYFGTKGGAQAQNLFNFVKDKINIDGTVNAIRDNKIGGNLYFLSSEGMVVGKNGVINTGSLHILTPTANAFNKALEKAKNNELFAGIVPEEGKIGIPLNPNGSIVISGKVNAVNDIRVDAAQIKIGKEGVLRTGVVDFSNLVNVDEIEDAENIELKVTRDHTKGDIILSAYADRSSQDKNLKHDMIKGKSEALIRKNIIASVESEGKIEAAKDVKISATVTNGSLKKIDGDNEIYKSEGAIANLEAKIDIKSGKIKGKNIDISATSKNYYDTPGAIKAGEFVLSALTGSISPINIKGSLGILTSKASINIQKDAVLESEEKTNINAFSGVRALMGNSTTPLKIKNLYLKNAEGKVPNIAAAYVNAESEASVNIEGKIKSKGEVDIQAKSVNTIDVNTNAGTMRNDNKVGLSVLVTKGVNKSSVNITKDAEITSNSDIKIGAETESSLRAKVAGTIGDKTNAIIAANISDYKSSSDVKIGGTVKSSGKLDINSKNTIKESILNTTSKIGTGGLINEIVMESEHTKELLEAIKNRFGGEDKKTKKSITDLFSIGASATIVNHDNSANIKIEKDARLSSNSGTTINALNKIENIHVETSSATLATREEENKKLNVGAALFYGNIKNRASVDIEDGSQIISEGKVDIKSSSQIQYKNVSKMIDELLGKVQNLKGIFSKTGEFNGELGTIDKNQFEAFEGLFLSLKRAMDEKPDLLTNGEKITITLPDGQKKTGTAPEIMSYLAEEIQKFGNSIPDVSKKNINNEKGFGENTKDFISSLAGIFKDASDFASIGNYANFYTHTSAATNPDKNTSVASASVSWLDLQNHSKVNIGKNAQIKAGGDLNIDSNNKTETVAIVGKAGLIKSSDKATTIGASMNIQNINTSSSVITKEKALLEGQKIDIQANSNVFNIASSLNAGGGGNSLNGMVSYIQGSSKNLISIDDETILTAKEEIAISSKNDTSITNVAGAVALGQKNAAVGVGIAINNYEVDNKVAIEDNDNGESKYDKDKSQVTINTQKFDVEAKTTGKINAASVAGGISKAGSDGGRGIFDDIGDKVAGVKEGAADTIGLLTNRITDFLNKGKGGLGSNLGGKVQGGNNSVFDKLVAPKFSLGAAGSTSLNLINKKTNVLIDGANIKFTEGKKSFNVSATDSSFIGAWSGAAALNWNFVDYGEKNVSAGLTGAAAVNKIDSSVGAILKNNVISGAKNIKVGALSGGTQIASGLGLAIAKDGGGHGKNFQFGTSASINLIENNVDSILENNIVNGNGEKTNVDLTAYNSDKQITGGLNLQLGESKGTLGGALSISKLKNKVNAQIKGGTYTNINNVNVKGILATTQVTSAVAAGITSTGQSGGLGVFEGAASYNEIDNSINSTIDGAKIDNANNVNVLARDTKSSSDLAKEYQSQIDQNHKDYLAKRGIDATGESYEVKDSKNLIGKKDGSVIVSAALAGSATNKASAGVGVSVNLIKNKFNAQIKNSEISANSANVNAQSNTTMVNVATGTAVSTSSFGGAGSVAWQEANNEIISKIENSKININTLNTQSYNGITGVNVAGQIAGGKGFAVGAVLANSNINNKTAAYILGSELNSISPNGLNLTVKAENKTAITTVAAGANVSSKNVGVGGTIAVNRVSSETESLVDKTSSKESKIENVNSIDISAVDKTNLNTISGSINGGKTAGIGGTIAYTDIGGSSSDNKKAKYIVKAGLNNTNIKTLGNGNINVEAKDNTVLTTVAGGISGSGSVAVQGSSATALINKKINSSVEGTNINKDREEDKNTNLNISAENSSTITTNASVIAAAPRGTGAGIGAGVSVNRIIQDTSASLKNSNANVKNALVKSKVSSEIKNIGIGVGVGVGGTGLGVSGSTAINKIINNNTASIENTNLNAKGNIGLITESDLTISSYAGTVSAGQKAALGSSTSVNEISGETKANIINSKVTANEETDDVIVTQGEVEKVTDRLFGNIDINSSLAKDRKKSNKKGIIVDSSSTSTVKTLLATAGGAVQGAVSGTVNVNVISGSTEANIIDSNLKGKNISIHSGDYTNSIGILGSAAGALKAGVGASSDTNIITRNTKTSIKGNKSNVEGENVNIDAEAKQGISSYTIGLAGAGVGAGIAGTVSVNKLSGKTEVDISDSTITATNNINILAKHQSNISVGNASAGAAGKGAGIGAAVSVNKDESETTVKIRNSNVTAANKLDINADNETNMKTAIVAAGVGVVGAGVSGTVSVNNITNKVILDINNSNLKAKNSDVNIKAHNKIKTALNSGGGSAGLAAVTGVVSVNTINSTVLTKIGNNSNITSEKGNANISSTEERDIKQIVANAGLGGVALGANVIINNFGTAVLDKENINVSKIFEEINQEQKEKFNNETLKLLQEKGIDKTNKDYSVNANKGETTGGIIVDIANSSIKANNVNILAQEKNDVDSTNGSGIVGLVAASGSVSINNVKRNLEINVTNSNILADKDLKAQANVLGKINAKVIQGSSSLLGIGAAYAETISNGKTLINIKNSNLKANNTNILAKDATELKTEATGVTAGVVSAGAIISKARNSSSVEVEIDNSTFNKDFNEGKLINIKTEKANKITATSDGGSFGAASGIGVVANAKDEGISSINVKNSSNVFNADVIGIEAFNKMEIFARTGSKSGAILGNVGVSQSEAIASGEAKVNISSGNKFIAKAINIGAKIGSISPNKKMAHSSTVSNGGGGIAGGEVNSASSETTTNVLVNVEKQNYLGKNTLSNRVETLNIYGENETSTQVDISSLNIGGLAATGSNKTISKNLSKTIVNAEGGRADNITLKAISSSQNTSSTTGNGGGFVAGGSIISDNLNKTKTTLNISGEWEVGNSINAKALDKSIASIKANSVKGGFIGNNGINMTNILQGETEVNIKKGTKIYGTGKVDIDAINDLNVNIFTEGAAYGGGGKSNSVINNKILKNAKVNIEGAEIKTSDEQKFQAFTKAKVDVTSKLYAAGAVSLTYGIVNSNIEFNNSVKVDKDSVLKTLDDKKNITLASSDDSNIRIEAFAETKGAGGEALTNLESYLTKKNTISVDGNVDSTNFLNIYAGKDKNGKESKMDLTLISHAYTYAFISKAEPILKNYLDVKNKVELGNEAKLRENNNLDIYDRLGLNYIRKVLKKYTWHSKKNIDVYVESKGGININILSNNPISANVLLSKEYRKNFFKIFAFKDEFLKISEIVSMPKDAENNQKIKVETGKEGKEVQDNKKINDSNNNSKTINNSLESYTAKKDVILERIKKIKIGGKTVFF